MGIPGERLPSEDSRQGKQNSLVAVDVCHGTKAVDELVDISICGCLAIIGDSFATAVDSTRVVVTDVGGFHLADSRRVLRQGRGETGKGAWQNRVFRRVSLASRQIPLWLGGIPYEWHPGTNCQLTGPLGPRLLGAPDRMRVVTMHACPGRQRLVALHLAGPDGREPGRSGRL